MGELVTTTPTIRFNVGRVPQYQLYCLGRGPIQDSKILAALLYGHARSDFRRGFQRHIRTHGRSGSRTSFLARQRRVELCHGSHSSQQTGSSSEMRDKLKLRSIHNEWFIQPCSATLGEGLYEGLDWLSDALAKQKK
jgi:ADP-ribosylation factor protein 1